MGRLYIVGVVHEWKNCKLNIGMPFSGDGESFGYAPVYKSEEKARADYPGRDIITVELTQTQEGE